MSRRISRRRFVQNTIAAGAAAAVAGHPRLLRSADKVSPNEKLNVAFIGTYNQASGDFNQIVASGRVNVIALCDVDEDKIDQAMDKPAAENARRFIDYREMLARIENEIDAVAIAIPDNQHFHAAAHAIQRGKHVFLEKPMCHDAWEVRRLTEMAREKKVVTQMGTQIHATDNYRRVVEKIQAGAIGKVNRVHVWVDGAFTADAKPITPPPKVPEYLHWDLWLGPAPERPYHPRLHPYFWRGWWDFGGGQLPDLGCHHMDLSFWALGLTAPTTVEAKGPDPDPESAPLWNIVDFQFPAVGERGPVHLTWYQGDKRPPHFAEGKLPKWGNGTLFEGDKGMLLASYGSHVLLPEEKFKDYQPPEPTIPPSIGHYKEWVHACLDNKPEAALCRFDYAGPLTEAVLLGVVSHRIGNRKIEWDPVAFKCPSAPEADRILKREYRKGWEI